jgi:hypothetical protein
MSAIAHYVALPLMKSGDEGDEIVACDPKEARSAEQAVRVAASLAKKDGHCGATAFSRTGDPALGDFDDAVVLKTVGEVDVGLVSCSHWPQAEKAVLPATSKPRLNPFKIA